MTDRVMIDINKERNRQDKKWGEQNHHPLLWLAILGEEYGEACKAELETNGTKHNLREELVQVAAVAVSAIESMDRILWRPRMSEDRLEEIKGRYDWHNQNGDFFYEAVVCGEKVQLVKDMAWLIAELEKCRGENKKLNKRIGWLEADLEETHQSRKEIIAGGKSVLESWAKERRHRKWALIEMKDKQRLWRNYCGEVSEQMDKVEDCRAEIKCLKAILANKGINF